MTIRLACVQLAKCHIDLLFNLNYGSDYGMYRYTKLAMLMTANLAMSPFYLLPFLLLLIIFIHAAVVFFLIFRFRLIFIRKIILTLLILTLLFFLILLPS